MYQNSAYAESAYCILDGSSGTPLSRNTWEEAIRESEGQRQRQQHRQEEGRGKGKERGRERGRGERERVIESTGACLRRDDALKLPTRWR
jgi:hypothetical protein